MVVTQFKTRRHLMEMKNIAEFISKPQFIDSLLIEELKRYLSERCNDYAEAEKQYLKRLQEFEGTGDTSKTIIREAIELREKSIAASMLFAGHLGFQANKDNFERNFRSPSQFDEPEEYLNESVMRRMPVSVQTTSKLRSVYETMTEEQKTIYEALVSHFVLLEDHGTKLAHFYGYMLANHLLYKMIPGYAEDQSQTQRYTKKLSTYLGFDVLSSSTCGE